MKLIDQTAKPPPPRQWPFWLALYGTIALAGATAIAIWFFVIH